MQESGVMKINNFKKKHNHATEVKGNPKIDSKTRKKWTKWKVEDAREPELLTIVKNERVNIPVD